MYRSVFAAAVVALLGVTGAATAATCSPGALGKVLRNDSGAAAACDAGSTNNDFVGGGTLQVNKDSIHGFSDWIYAGKQNTPGAYENGKVDVGFSVSGGLQSGTWDFVDNLFSLYKNVMIVLKGGSGNNTQENYVGYLLNSSLEPDGRYATPFFNANNANAKDISHITAYVRDALPPISEIPVPAAAWLLIAGLGSLGAMKLRRKA